LPENSKKFYDGLKIQNNFCNDGLKIQRIFYGGSNIQKNFCNDGLEIQKSFYNGSKNSK